MGAKNKVVAGDYVNRPISSIFGSVNLTISMKEVITLNKSTVEQYETITEESTKSAASAVGRGLIGGALLGPVGLLAGLSAKSKGIHTLAIQFKDGKKSLVEIDDKIYKTFIQKMF